MSEGRFILDCPRHMEWKARGDLVGVVAAAVGKETIDELIVSLKGVNYIDGTLLGLGRAAGNCPLELLVGFLKNPKFDIVPILDAIGNAIVPLREQFEWGYQIPYVLTGQRDEHPREAMRWMTSENKHDYVAFYKEIIGGYED